MQLTEDERAALERFRTPIDPLGVGPMAMEQRRRDAFAVAHAMTRLFPVRTYGNLVIRWDDEVTLKKLVACGATDCTTHVSFHGPNATLLVGLGPVVRRWAVIDRQSKRTDHEVENMLDVWQLMERCGIEEPVAT